MGQFKGNEPKQFGVPNPRYSRHLVRTNAMTQDANCMPVAPVAVPGRIGWASAPGQTTGYAESSAGTATVFSSDIVLNFSLLLPAQAGPNFTVTLAGNSIGGTLVYNQTTGLGSYTIDTIGFGNANPGTARLELRSNGVLQGALEAVVSDTSNSSGYDTAQWVAFSAV